jgi:hypothetical protein
MGLITTIRTSLSTDQWWIFPNTQARSVASADVDSRALLSGLTSIRTLFARLEQPS